MAASEDPTPRRRALARRAGVVPTSAAWASAGAWAGAAIAMIAAGGAAAGALRAWAADAVASAAAPGAIARAQAVATDDVITRTLGLAAPIAIAAALAALVAHGALVRGAWLPRRRIRGAPSAAGGAGRRAGDAVLAIARGAAVLAVAVHFAIVHLGDAARLGAWRPELGAGAALALLGAGVAHVAIAIALVGLLDALERGRRHRADLRMTPREKRDEDREARGDPRWRTARRRVGELPAVLAVRDAAVVVAGDRVAAAVRWHPRAHPVPVVIARGRGALAAQVQALARRAGVPSVHAPALAAELARVAIEAPVPERLHAQLAALLATIAPPPR